MSLWCHVSNCASNTPCLCFECGYLSIFLIAYRDKINGYANHLNDLPIQLLISQPNIICIKMRDYKHNHWRSWRCFDLCYPFYYDMKIFGHLDPKKYQYIFFLILICIWSFILIMLVSLFWKLCPFFISISHYSWNKKCGHVNSPFC